MATNDVAGPQGVVVYQRYEADAGVRAMRAYGMSFQFDAGLPDAGVDGGADAGGEDAGSDAGTEGADAGVMTFQTSGCSCDSAAMAPVLLLVLALATKKRR